mgnify:CR=1 FL=1
MADQMTQTCKAVTVTDIQKIVNHILCNHAAGGFGDGTQRHVEDVKQHAVGRGLLHFSVQTLKNPTCQGTFCITQTGEGKFKFVIGEGHSKKGPIPPTGNTNTRGFFEPNTRDFVKKWVMEGPTHHYALGIGHHADTIAKIAEILGISRKGVNKRRRTGLRLLREMFEGTEDEEDKGGLANFQSITPDILIKTLNGKYHMIFKDESLTDSDNEVIDRLYKDLFEFEAIDICKLSDIADSWNGKISNSKDFIELFFICIDFSFIKYSF